MPNAQTLKTYVDSVWEVQANVWFNIQDKVSNTIDYDDSPADGKLELGDGTPGISLASQEMRKIEATISKIWKDSHAEIKVSCVVASNPGTNPGFAHYGAPTGSPNAFSYWVFAAEQSGQLSHETVLARELGHCLSNPVIEHNSTSNDNLMIKQVNEANWNPKEIHHQEWSKVKRP